MIDIQQVMIAHDRHAVIIGQQFYGLRQFIHITGDIAGTEDLIYPGPGKD